VPASELVRRRTHRVLPFALPLVLAAFALVAGACGGDSDDSTVTPGGGSSDSGQKTVAGLAVNDHGTKDVTGMDEIQIEADDYYFEPTILKGKPGQKITIEIDNESSSSTEHNFSQSAQSVSEDIEAGETTKVTVTFPDSGTISFFCKYHKGSGMGGGLQSGAGGVSGRSGTSGDDSDSSGYGNY
jgi:plastocyanin